VPQNFNAYTHVTGIQGFSQTIAQGPVAAQQWIELMGTNGGGFFNANTGHPYENPTPLTNIVEMLAIVVLPAALTNTFGRMIQRAREGWLLFWVMTALFAVGVLLCGAAEQAGNPNLTPYGTNVSSDAAPWTTQPGGNMEGKEARVGIGGSVLAAEATSSAATGSTNSSDDSYMPLGGMIPVVNMLLGEMIFGGLGTGLYSSLMVALLGLFITGLMVGRTPEYVGKKIGEHELKIVMVYTLIAPVGVLLLTALAVVTDAGRAGLTTNSGPHGLTEILNAYTSTFANNGQTFAGLSANSIFYNLTTVVTHAARSVWVGDPGPDIGQPVRATTSARTDCRHLANGYRALRERGHRDGTPRGGADLSSRISAWPDRGALAIDRTLTYRPCALALTHCAG
jgi:K+-transporting ATPase ATPase A chain